MTGRTGDAVVKHSLKPYTGFRSKLALSTRLPHSAFSVYIQNTHQSTCQSFSFHTDPPEHSDLKTALSYLFLAFLSTLMVDGPFQFLALQLGIRSPSLSDNSSAFLPSRNNLKPTSFKNTCCNVLPPYPASHCYCFSD